MINLTWNYFHYGTPILYLLSSLFQTLLMTNIAFLSLWGRFLQTSITFLEFYPVSSFFRIFLTASVSSIDIICKLLNSWFFYLGTLVKSHVARQSETKNPYTYISWFYWIIFKFEAKIRIIKPQLDSINRNNSCQWTDFKIVLCLFQGYYLHLKSYLYHNFGVKCIFFEG